MKEFQRGTKVKFREVMEPGDELTRMEVLEDNGNRVLVRYINTLPISDTHTYLKSDLILV